MQIIQTKLSGVFIIEPKVFPDERGYFLETFQQQRYHDCGIALPFVQDNFSRSKQDVIRGLHYQLPHTQGKLVFVTFGKILDVIVDIRKTSATFGEVISIELSAENHRQVYIPPGFAHGFCVMSSYADFIYKCTDYYFPECERGIHWQDPTLQIQWPDVTPIVTSKDDELPLLKNIPLEELPT